MHWPGFELRETVGLASFDRCDSRAQIPRTAFVSAGVLATLRVAHGFDLDRSALAGI